MSWGPGWPAGACWGHPRKGGETPCSLQGQEPPGSAAARLLGPSHTGIGFTCEPAMNQAARRTTVGLRGGGRLQNAERGAIVRTRLRFCERDINQALGKAEAAPEWPPATDLWEECSLLHN